MGMASDNAFSPLIRVPRVRSQSSMVKCHLKNALCIVPHLPIVRMTRKPPEQVNSLFAEASSARAWGLVIQ